MELATATLTKRRDELLHQVHTLVKFQKAIVENHEEVVVNTTRKELCTLSSISTLEEMDKSLSMVEEMMCKDAMDLTEFGKFGEVSIDGGTLTSETLEKKSATETVSGKGQTVATRVSNSTIITAGAASFSRFPANVDYEAKQSLWKLVIATQAKGCDEFKPTHAVYSPLEDAMYCLSDGKILRYDAKSGVGKIACGIFEVKHMTLTDSGSLILIDEKQMVKLTAERLENPKNDGFDFALTNFPAATKATQVCSYGKEVIVLDAAERRFLRYHENGHLLGEIKVEGNLFDFSNTSKMWVDQNGLVYASDLLLKVEDGLTAWNSCHNEPKSVKVKWTASVIMILNSDGSKKRRIDIDRDVADQKDYAFDTYEERGSCGHSHKRIVRNSIPSRGDMISKATDGRGPTTGLCVDADGYVLITRPGKNQIDVYDPDGHHYCTIGDHDKSELKEPTGLSLMPDGRMVVCDTGNNRMLIF